MLRLLPHDSLVDGAKGDEQADEEREEERSADEDRLMHTRRLEAAQEHKDWKEHRRVTSDTLKGVAAERYKQTDEDIGAHRDAEPFENCRNEGEHDHRSDAMEQPKWRERREEEVVVKPVIDDLREQSEALRPAWPL